MESDGSVFPCDFYALDQYKGGNINDMDIMQIAQNKVMQGFLNEEKQMRLLCEKCFFVSICHGNCKRMSTLYFRDKYCGYQDFLRHDYPTMSQIAKQLYK